MTATRATPVIVEVEETGKNVKSFLHTKKMKKKPLVIFAKNAQLLKQLPKTFSFATPQLHEDMDHDVPYAYVLF